MADYSERNKKNVPGTLYNDYSCIDCCRCPDIAPQIFTRDDEEGYSYVYKQPQTKEEHELANEAMESCPTESIGKEDL